MTSNSLLNVYKTSKRLFLILRFYLIFDGYLNPKGKFTLDTLTVTNWPAVYKI